MRKGGADSFAFETIAVSGDASALPHGTPRNVKLRPGFLTMDFGAKFEGYCADMTRTVAVGSVSDEKREIYNRVLEAQLMALESLKEGVSGEYVDKVARDYLDKHYKNAFVHSLGHSVGLYIHEAPNLSPRNKNPIKENTVITVEPGVYLEGNTGVRIEDLTVVKRNGCKILSKSPKELIIL